MPDIQHSLRIKAPPEAIYREVTSPDRITRWWTKASGEGETEGGQLDFEFPGNQGGACVRVTGLVPARWVEWEMLADSPEEWIGTHVRFQIEPLEEGRALLRFSHAGWRESTDLMAQCNHHWGLFVWNLKRLSENKASA